MPKKYGVLSELNMPKTDKLKAVNENKDFATESKRKAKKTGGLVPANELSPEARKYNATLAGVASQEKRRNTAILSETMKMLLTQPLPEKDEIREILASKGFDNEQLTEATAICFAQVQRARVDTKSFEVVRDTIGQKPVERQVVLSNEQSGADIVRKHFGEYLKE